MYTELSAPLSCQLEITSRCNQECQHCYNFWRANKSTQSRTLAPDEAGTIIRKLVRAQVFDLVITGGEPLMAFKTLVACLHEARAGGLNVALNSNLLPLTEARARELRQLGVSGILTSLMGPDAETHDALAQRPGAFNILMRNIAMAQEAGINITANMVVSKKNRHLIKETARLARSVGIRKFCATKAGCPGNCHDFSEHALSLEEFRGYLRDLAEAGIELDLTVNALEGYPLCGVEDLDAYHFAVGRKCTAGVSTITIASDGAVRPCPHLDESCGNLLTEELPDIWGRMRSWRNGDFLPADCKSYSLLGICGSGCRMAAKMERGSLVALDPYCVPEDATRALQTMRARQVRTEKRQIGDGASFIVLPYRVRPEPFGSSVMSRKHRVALLDTAGTDVLEQMQPGTSYALGDGHIQWGTIDPKQFVLGMERHGLVAITE